MNEQLQNLIDYTHEKLGLNDYYLKRHHFFREINNLNETAYILNMEWFPKELTQSDEDYNPPGTAVIDINFHTKAVKRIIFVEDVSYAESSLYPSSEKENAIEWIEELTGLTFGRQFLLVSEDDNVLSFGAAVDNIPVAPTGTIELEFNNEGKLTIFSIDGDFPNEDQIQWEPFSLTPDKYEPLASRQCKLIEVPDKDQEKWLPIYGIEEIYLVNDGERTIPFDKDLNSFVKKNSVMKWDKPSEGEFIKQDTDLSIEVTLDQLLANEPHPDTIPITNTEVETCEQEVLRFLQLEFPNESGEWKLTGLYLENGYIFAELKPTKFTNRAFDRKIKLMIDRENYNAVNYIDNDMLLDMFKHFKDADDPSVSQEEAFEKIRDYVEVEPVYVYNNEKNSYIMCGKMDCPYGVNAITGDIVLLAGL
ncbi:hypothetical protein [Virgibacillus litoralis]|uniref:Uncharacterized protein n=1 Tax=Virgibacillus litoralis TaxID=578221 RepID=A0ABS4HDK1_9BACI|nr:hypothetical protein [Virgibacillus litoralis]MBP1948999.1 hypothetical protein [Virgibacillus litoralis]